MLEPIRRQQQDFPSRLSLDPMTLHDIMTLARQLHDELEHQAQGYQHMAQGYLLHLIITLSRHYACLHDDQATGLLRLSAALIFMEEHFHEPITIGELATRAAMSERHFYRLFRQTFQVAPSERLLELRIRHACRLLQDRALTITEVAYASGFRDSNYFTRQFNRLIGNTPRAYRRAILAQKSHSDVFHAQTRSLITLWAARRHGTRSRIHGHSSLARD